MNRPLLVALAVFILVSGCGGGSAKPPKARTPRPPAPAGDVSVIRRWADTLRAGDVAATLLAVLDEPASIGTTFDLVAGDAPIRDAVAALGRGG